MVIAGAGEAGTAGAIALREGGWRGPIVLIGNETMLPYERPPLSKAILMEEMDPQPKLLVTPERLAELGIEYFEGRNVQSLDRVVHTVTLSDGTQVAYQRLLLTTGARPRKLSIPVAAGSRIATLRTYADALAIRRTIGRGCEVVAIGGGFSPGSQKPRPEGPALLLSGRRRTPGRRMRLRQSGCDREGNTFRRNDDRQTARSQG